MVYFYHKHHISILCECHKVTYLSQKSHNMSLSNESYVFICRIKLKCGLVRELTLRVNTHSNGQESPLSHHFVF